MRIMLIPENGTGGNAYADLPVIPPNGSTVVVRRMHAPTRTFIVMGFPNISYLEGDDGNDSVDVDLVVREVVLDV